MDNDGNIDSKRRKIRVIKSDTDIDSETVENEDSSKWEDAVESERIIFISI